VTRAAVDEQIASVKIELDEAVKRLAFDECGPLQDKLDELTAKQAELPTVDELRAAVAAAEASMSLAAKNRDFASAAAAQANIAEAQKRLLDTLAANEDTENGGENQKKSSSSITSPLELRLEIKSLKAAVDDAVSRKDFASAASLTDTLAGLEKKLECELLTQQELTKAAPTLASAVLENGEKVVFASRTELERTIASAMYSVSQFASGRDFKKAAAAQTRVDDMVKLRELLPSAEELKQQIISTTREMEVAVSNKEFVTAEKLSHAIEEMERKMKNAGASVPAHISSTEHTEEYRAEPGIPARASVSEATKNVAPLKLPAVAKVPASMPIAPTAATAVVPKAIVRAATSSSSVQSRLSASVKGDNSGRAASIMSVVSTKQAGQSITEVQRTVAKLRPADPLIGNVSETVHAIAKRLTTNRRNACMLVDENGMLAGILTDTDITRRVASKFLDPADTVVSSVMTPRPTCVSMTDAAMDALTIMVENRFRHLPVVDSAGSLVGGLDLTKCLNDAITKLEKNHEKASRSAESIVHQVLSRQTNGGGVEAASLQALLGSLMAQAMGSPTMPTIQGLLTGKPGTIVGPDSSIRDASILMSDNRKAALVVQGGELLGVFTFKDLMTRAIAKELPLDTTPVSEVMTPSPEYITPDKTVLEALQLMHDHRFLTLPVCEDDGTVIGLVDAMDVIYGCGGADGWKSLFSTAMGLQDDSSDVLSIGGSRAPKSLVSGLQPPPRLVSLDETIPIRPKSTANDKTVAKLRPSPPCLSRTDDSILSVAQLLKSKRLSASLVVRGDGTLAGIVTDTDITRRVVAKNVDPEYTSISDIMTPDPTVVATTDAAMDALTIMVENRFRHLPVVDDEGSVVGVLDVAKCLDDAISKLEKSHEQGQVTTEVAVKQAIVEQGGNVAQASALLALLGNILSQNMGGKGIPTLRAVLAGKPSSIVSPNSSVREAGMRMAECRKAALIVDHGELVGIFSFKDCMVRAVAAGLPLESTPVCQVMTPNPEFVSPDATVLEALQIMHDHRFLTLPVCESDGTVMGVADVMDVICASGGPDGWRSIFSSAMHLDDGSVGASGMSKQIASAVSARGPQAVKAENRPQVASAVPSNIPATLEFFDADGDNSFTGSTIGDERGVSKLLSPEDTSGSMGILDFVSFKVTTSSGSTHRIRCEPTVKDLAGAIEAKSSIPQSRMRIEYEDDEGDVVVISNDDDVTEAFKLARKSGKKIAKLTVVETEVKAKAVSTALIGGGLAAVALLGAFAVLMLRPKKH
jgi:CBS domain-containing protein